MEVFTIEDNKIIELFFSRSEDAILETSSKYGGYCYSIAYNVLSNQQDSEECVSDTYLAAWNTIPPEHPTLLRAFLGKITRRISIDHWRKCNASKRNGGEIPIALEELDEIAGHSGIPEEAVSINEITESINRFLKSQTETERQIFLCRYWYMDSIETISGKAGFSISKTTSILHRIRVKLKNQLEKEGLL